MPRELPPIVYAIAGDGKSLTVSASQHVDFSGAKMLSRAEAAQYKIVTPLVADAERRAMVFSQSASKEKADRPRRDDESTGNPLKDFIRWVVAARKDLAEWNPTAPNRDDAKSPSALLEEHVRRQRLAVDAGGDGRIIAGIELRPPANLLARDVERRVIEAVLSGQKIKVA